ncbi:hypothetical protein J437_LFUL008324 [Ladona fulva]|uniref:Inosine/uridine-preferring nucleoside hydrolase domain-containing protein n=1 Tax=Ladona fulva TaxID=123851 RepID=A0A8K0P171_LADFU|nr:hypothetical protein J437_LFUL008324 [Ladona fulva]
MCFLILLLFSAVLSFGKCESMASPVGKILMDVDVGNDDAWALLMATSNYAQNILGTELIGITCVQGNTEVDHVVVNVLKVLKTVNRLDIPVYRGADKSLIYTPPGDNYYGIDGFGDFEFPDPPNPDEYLQKEHAVNAMIKLVNQHPGEVTLIALGPLTNVALAIRMDSGFLNKLKKLVVLGGSVKGVGNMFPGIEFNFYVDPHAARIVFNSTQNPICVYSWEFAKASSLSSNWRMNVLGHLDNPKVSLMNKAEHIVNYTRDYWLIADGFTTSAILRPDLIIRDYETSVCGGQKYYVRVETDGLYTKGMMTVDYANFLNREPNAEIVDRIDKDKFMEFLLKCME